MNRKNIEKRLEKADDHRECRHSRPLAPAVDVAMWFDPEDSCDGLDTANIYVVAKSEHYRRQSVTFVVQVTSTVVKYGDPTEGVLEINPPQPHEIFAFDFDVIPVTAQLTNRKANCIVDWFIGDGDGRFDATTSISVLTKA